MVADIGGYRIIGNRIGRDPDPAVSCKAIDKNTGGKSSEQSIPMVAKKCVDS